MRTESDDFSLTDVKVFYIKGSLLHMSTSLFELVSDITTPMHEIATVNKTCADPIFTMDDVYSAPDELTKLVRFYFVKNNIGESQFKEMIRVYCQERGTATNKESSMKGNLISNLKKFDKVITYRTAVQIWSIMGLDMNDLTISFRNRRTGENFKLSTSDISEKSREPDPVLDKCMKEFNMRMKNNEGSTIKVVKS